MTPSAIMDLELPTLDMIQCELARRELIRFTTYTKPDYLAGWFHHKLAKALDKFLADVVARKSPRLIIMAPPRHGKTELTSRRFPAYALGKYPDMSFIATSYASDLASSINRDIQRIIDSEEYARVFPGTTLWGKNIRTVADGSYLRNSDIFEVVNRQGVYKSAGVGAGVTGRGGNVLLIDDPVKDAAEAHSETVRNGIWEWFTSTLYTRCAPGGGILLIMTRWHEDDLAGRLLANIKRGGEHWDVIKFPAIAEQDEYDEETGELLRREGEALHPERYDIDALNNIKKGTSDEPGLGSKVFTSLYQQNPTAAEGGIFKREYWKYITPPKLVSAMQPEERKLFLRELGVQTILQRWDTAIGGKKQNDYCACATLACAKNRYYLLDVWKERMEYPEMLREIESRKARWTATRVNVEGGGSASGKAAVQSIKRETVVPIFETITATDKVLRAETVSPSVECGLVYLFSGEPWHADFIDQCANFPNIAFDDDVDAFIGVMEEAISGPKPMNINPALLSALGVRR